MLIDSHCHLADDAFADDLETVAERARAAGVSGALCILAAEDAGERQRVSRVRAAWPGVRFAAGVHPQRAGDYADQPDRAAAVTAAALDEAGAVALGEIGLDYHYDTAPRPVQRAVLSAQLALAVERQLPVVIHTREASDDTYAALAEWPAVRGVMHCFSGSIEEARRALDLGFYLSLSGIVTFPKAGSLRDVAAFAPLDRLLVETDAPYLAPVPCRGKRNEPAWVAHTAAAVAAARGMPVAELSERVSRNFEALLSPEGAGRAR